MKMVKVILKTEKRLKVLTINLLCGLITLSTLSNCESNNANSNSKYKIGDTITVKYKSGELKSKIPVSQVGNSVFKHGKRYDYYKNGNIKRVSKYDSGEITDDYIVYYKNGKLKNRFFYFNEKKFSHAYYYNKKGYLNWYRLYSLGGYCFFCLYDTLNRIDSCSGSCTGNVLYTRGDYSFFSIFYADPPKTIVKGNIYAIRDGNAVDSGFYDLKTRAYEIYVPEEYYDDTLIFRISIIDSLNGNLICNKNRVFEPGWND